MKGVDESRINSIGQYLFFFLKVSARSMDTDKLLDLHGKKTKWVFTIRIYIVIDRDEQFEYIINSVYDRIGWLISYSLEDLIMF